MTKAKDYRDSVRAVYGRLAEWKSVREQVVEAQRNVGGTRCCHCSRLLSL